MLVTVPGEQPAGAAFPGQPWQTNFEIDGNQVVNGPSPPSSGAGIDWANGASLLQNFATPTEACTGTDPTTLTGKLDAFNLFAPNPVPGSVTPKTNLCQAFTGWQAVNVTQAGVSSLHYILYGGWRRNAVTGDVSLYVPLVGGQTRSGVTLIKFDYDPSGGGTTTVNQLRWNGSTWVEGAIAPATAFTSAVARPAAHRRSWSSRST